MDARGAGRDLPAAAGSIVRLLADDLTGALDTAAEFAAMAGPVRTVWAESAFSGLAGHAAVDLGTRELPREAARARTAAAAVALAGAGIAFKKVDSLLRGHPMTELAACLAAGAWPCCVLAPAFPFQGRVTRGGVQHVRTLSGGWAATGGDMLAGLAAQGVGGRLWRSGEPLGAGVTLFDAETDGDLAAAVCAGRSVPGPVLWCGSSGLAAALAGPERPWSGVLPRPLLGVFGTDRDVTAAQLAQCAPHWHALPHDDPGNAAIAAVALARHGAALVSFMLPPGVGREEAAGLIAAAAGRIVRGVAAPGTLVAAGGETLRALCEALGAVSLDAAGRLEPGVPVSILRGGAWDGVTVVSKSGAFGGPGLLRGLLPPSVLPAPF